VELATGKSFESGFTQNEPRSTSALEAAVALIPGSKVESTTAKFLDKAIVSLDNNALIHAVENNGKQAVKDAIGSARPIVSVTAAKEFLAKGEKTALKSFMKEIGASISNTAKTEQVNLLRAQAESMGKKFGLSDAKIAADAITGV
jgi:hypothetical protein